MKKTVFKTLELGGAVLDLQFTLLAFQFDALGAQFLALFLQFRTLQEHGHNDAHECQCGKVTAESRVGSLTTPGKNDAENENGCNYTRQPPKKPHGMFFKTLPLPFDDDARPAAPAGCARIIHGISLLGMKSAESSAIASSSKRRNPKGPYPFA